MSTPLTAAQEIATAGPAAPGAAPAPLVPAGTAISAPAAPPPPHCENCGASVPGRFCGNCGQRLDPPVHSLWHFTQVAAEDLTHADSRLWGTLAALLFKPGFLTREFFRGRRARYLPPVRLYLVLSVVFFVWLAATGQTPDEAHITPAAGGAIGESRIIVPSATGAGAAPAKASSSGSALEGDEQHCKLINYNGPWNSSIRPLLYRSCVKAAQDHGRSLGQSMLHNLPRAMFLFLPLLAGVMMLLYWHPRRYYVEHLLFCVHNHAFAFLVLMVAGLVSWLLPVAATAVGWVTTLYVAWYLYRSMRVMYGQGRLRTGAKLGVLSFVYLVAGSLMVMATAIYALVTL